MKDYVYGISKSGLAVIKLLKKQDKNFECWDDSKKTRYLLKKKFKNLNLIPINKINLKNYNNIYVTPGVSINDKKFLKAEKSCPTNCGANLQPKDKTKSHDFIILLQCLEPFIPPWPNIYFSL